MGLLGLRLDPYQHPFRIDDVLYGKPLFQSLTHGYDVNHVLLPPTVLYVFNQLLYTLQNSKKVPAYKNPLKVMGKINT